MVLEITVERDYTIEDPKTDAYTVRVDTQRILTVVTHSESIVTKWLKDALKSSIKSAVLVGITAETENRWCWHEKDRHKEYPYDFLCLNIGAQSLVYETWETYFRGRHSLVSFLENPRVFVIGREMANISRKLKVHHGIEIRNAVDVNDLAIRGLRRDDLDLGRYDLDQLARAVLGKQMDLARPEDDFYWKYRDDEFHRWTQCDELKLFWAIDPYLCFLIGLELIDAIDGAASQKKKTKKKKKT